MSSSAVFAEVSELPGASTPACRIPAHSGAPEVAHKSVLRDAVPPSFGFLSARRPEGGNLAGKARNCWTSDEASNQRFEVEHLLDVRHQDQLDAAVLLAEVVAVVLCHRIGVAVARRVEPFHAQAAATLFVV